MAYHDLSTCTLTADERRSEAVRIISIITEQIDLSQLTDNEASLFEKVDMGYPISVKQLFWLRDIKDKYL